MPLTRPRTAQLSDADGFLNVVGMIKPHSSGSAPVGWLNCDGASVLRATYLTLFNLIGTTFGSVDGTHFNVPDLRGRSPIGSGQGTFTSSFLNTAVNAGTNQITVTANEHFVTGQKVQISTTGTLPSPLLVSTDYYIIVSNSTTISLTTTLANAQNATNNIDITTQGTGTHTLTWQNYTSRAIGVKGGEEAHALIVGEMVSHNHTQNSHNHTQDAHGHTFSSGNTAAQSGATNGQAAQNNAGVTSNDVATNQAATATNNPAGGNIAMNNLQPFIALNWIIKT